MSVARNQISLDWLLTGPRGAMAAGHAGGKVRVGALVEWPGKGSMWIIHVFE